eukprot:gnl/TRDRNA2_/TRDRNA2_177807_c2_seq3.p3 gnl/TRDRNA2_/TRDRNA2_177807_c2~~gnl/TRDRNA2_/TRDRNA2_177807_c2_seq3.p3  ORF type:complete len:136 (-),score=0.52 gnl/TRDRNA2_/TRDRNA2_177807_c2_seq3:670-1077(-)
MVLAFRRAGQSVPEDLLDIATNWIRKRKRGLVFDRNVGYTGSGYKFDITEENESKQRKIEKALAIGYCGAEEIPINDVDEISTSLVERTHQISSSDKNDRITGLFLVFYFNKHKLKFLSVSLIIMKCRLACIMND